jgi:hypothetical protein
MSVLVEGVRVSTASFSSIERTHLSLPFFRTLVNPRNHRLLFTTDVPGYGPISAVLEAQVDSTVSDDIVLGRDWATYLRESLIVLGFRLDDSFNGWEFLVRPKARTEISCF